VEMYYISTSVVVNVTLTGVVQSLQVKHAAGGN
jgi:hypothetical protein